jgi:hypothetical protein
MSNEISSTQLSELNFEVFGVTDGTKVIQKFGQKGKGEAAQQARRMFAVSEFVRRDLDAGGFVKADQKYTDVVGFSAGHVSSMLNIGRVLHYVANGKHGENTTELQRSKTVAQSKNLEAAWNERFPQGEPGRVSFAAAAIALTSDGATGDGLTITRGGAAVKCHQAFGDIQSAMGIARGPKEESGDEESGDDESQSRQSWQEMVAEAARRAAEDGASLIDVVALVREVMGS